MVLPPGSPDRRPRSLLDVDPGLAELVPSESREAARRRSVAEVIELRPGAWEYEPPQGPAVFGLFLLDGLVAGRVEVGAEAHLEVLGEGDVLRPWVHLHPEANIPSQLRWHVLEEARVAVLDERFAYAVAPWPQIAAGLMHRLVLRARRLSLQLAMAGVERVGERLLIALWHFADRWGVVTPEGVCVRLGLTHAELAEVIRAARPSVSSAISELRREGRLSVERASQLWKLHGEPPPLVAELKQQIGLA